jgi:hypothetical protein
LAVSDHAGFAAAVTVREQVLKTALLAAYANGSFPTALAADLPGGPPVVATDLFLGRPEVTCEGATNLLVLTLNAWGPLRVTLDGTEHVAQIAGQLELTIRPVFTVVRPDSSVQLRPSGEDIAVRHMTVSVTSAGTPAEVVDYLTGDQFKDRMQQAIRSAIVFQAFQLPTIDLSFFGPLVRLATSVMARVRPGVLLLGLNVGSDSDPIVGDVEALADFARGNDVAGVVNPAATALLLDDLHTRMVTDIEANGASLEQFSVTPAAGSFQVSGRASKSSGAVNFSFRVVPILFHRRLGKVLSDYPKRRANERIWAVLGFRIEDVHTDVDRSWWVVILEVFVGILTLGMAVLYVENLVSSAGRAFSAQVKAAKPGPPAARIRVTVPPPGGVGVRIGVDQFEITSAGTFIGISIRATPTPAALLGPVSVPSTYASDVLRYLRQLPSGESVADPALRIHWTLRDRTNNTVLAEQDGPAATQLRFEFSPATFPGAQTFQAAARLYRRLGANVTELGTESVDVHLRGSLPPAAYLTWRTGRPRPRVTVSEATDEWLYLGETTGLEWSKWHRTDAPCRAVNARSRSRFDIMTADRLPFSLRLLEDRRGDLCPYCFYGGPAGVNSKL